MPTISGYMTGGNTLRGTTMSGDPFTIGPAYARVQSAGSSSGRSSSSSALSGVQQYIGMLQDIARQNSESSAKQAQIQRDWQVEQNAKAMTFEASEAAKNRDWQKMMSDTAHQREIRDLQAAGLNPVLSAMGGNGAAVTSGSMASGYTSAGAMGEIDTSTNSALVSLLGSLIQSQTQLANTATSAMSNQAIADKYTAATRYSSELALQGTKYGADTSAHASMTNAGIYAAASRYAAEVGADASKVAAAIHAAAQRYGYDVMSSTQENIAKLNNAVNRAMQLQGFQHDFDIRRMYPSSMSQMISSLFGQGSGRGDGLDSVGAGLDKLFDLLSGVGSASSHYSKYPLG